MNGWIILAITLGPLLVIGVWVDWQRRGSGGGSRRPGGPRHDPHAPNPGSQEYNTGGQMTAGGGGYG
jgi:hypothetical protein